MCPGVHLVDVEFFNIWVHIFATAVIAPSLDKEGKPHYVNLNTCHDVGILVAPENPYLQFLKRSDNKSDVETKNARVFKVNLHQDLGQEVELDIRFERKVVIYFGDKLAYEADSLVSVKDHKTLGLLAKHEFGLGQNMEPNQSFWNDYTLNAPGVVDCYIRETFVRRWII
ncbi:hypothetical protein BDC45DRAFT_564847 [Circinella umbellata]|nr:hypothetical protein BDC45DRAFT_564847 [Circinella umbellata]